MKLILQFICFVFFFCLFSVVNAQPQFKNELVNIGDHIHLITNHDKSIEVAVTKRGVIGGGLSPLYVVPDGDEIIFASDYTKQIGGATHIFIVLLLKSDKMVIMEIDEFKKFKLIKNDGLLPPSVKTADVSEMNGDDFYILTNSNLYVSRDTFVTWSSDTLGLGGVPVSLAFDKNHYIYALMSNSLFKQAEGSTTWSKISGLTGTGFRKVFVDRNLNIYVSGPNKILKSIDNGLTFNLDTTGIQGQQALKFGQDTLGNIFCISSTGFFSKSGNRLYRSMGGNTSWVRIDLPITSGIVNLQNEQIYNAIQGRDTLFLATAIGVFISTDHGNSWEPRNNGIPTSNLAGMCVMNNGRKIISSPLGIFYQNQGSGSWVKSLPVTGNLFGQALFKDKNEIVYTTVKSIIPSLFSNSPKEVWKSTDGGLTWSLDTAGLSVIKMYSYYVDENGVQHAAGTANGNVIELFIKPIGQPWQPDNIGFTSGTTDIPLIWGSDKNGTIYLSTSSLSKPNVWKKTGTGTWLPDTAGITKTSVYNFAVEKNGTMLAGAYNGLYNKVGGVWTQIPNPPGTNPNFTNSCFVVNVDSAGAIWAQFSIFDTKGTAIGTGVYFSNDHGVTWTSMNLDTLTFRQLLSVGDKTYGISYYNGIYEFSKNGTSGLPVVTKLFDDQFLSVFPNPSSIDEITISCDPISFKSNAKISIQDESGREILKNEMSSPLIKLNIKDLPNGIYIATLISGSNIYRAKFIVNR